MTRAAELATSDNASYAPFALRNRILNGNFDIWQRALTQSASGYGSDDRWANENIGTTKVHSQQGFALGQSLVPGNPRAYSRTVVTSVAGASNYCCKTHKFESVDTFSGKNVTLSFWAKADAAKNIAIEFSQFFGAGGSPSTVVYAIGAQKIALSTTWTKYTATVAIPSVSGKARGSDGNDSLNLYFWFDAGTSSASRTNTLGQQSGTFDLAQIQLEEGVVATPFESRPYGMELALCQRFYESQVYCYTGYGTAGAAIASSFPYKVSKRRAPTVAHSSTSYVNIGAVSNNAQLDSNVLSSTVAATGGFQLYGIFSTDAEFQ